MGASEIVENAISSASKCVYGNLYSDKVEQFCDEMAQDSVDAALHAHEALRQRNKRSVRFSSTVEVSDGYLDRSETVEGRATERHSRSSVSGFADAVRVVKEAIVHSMTVPMNPGENNSSGTYRRPSMPRTRVRMRREQRRGSNNSVDGTGDMKSEESVVDPYEYELRPEEQATVSRHLAMEESSPPEAANFWFDTLRLQDLLVMFLLFATIFSYHTSIKYGDALRELGQKDTVVGPHDHTLASALVENLNNGTKLEL